jgi:hypothetical protein
MSIFFDNFLLSNKIQKTNCKYRKAELHVTLSLKKLLAKCRAVARPWRERRMPRAPLYMSAKIGDYYNYLLIML